MSKTLKNITVGLYIRISQNLDNEINRNLEEYNKKSMRPLKKSAFIQMCIEKGCTSFAHSDNNN